MIRVGIRMVRYLNIWRFEGCISKETIANIGDKIIFTYEDKVYSGELKEIGTKNIRIKEYPVLHKKHSFQWATGKFAIDKIERLAVYPKCTQAIEDIYCNSIDKCMS